VASSATCLGSTSLDLDDPLSRQPRTALGDELLDAIDRPDAFGRFASVKRDERPLAVHAAPLVQWSAPRDAPH